MGYTARVGRLDDAGNAINRWRDGWFHEQGRDAARPLGAGRDGGGGPANAFRGLNVSAAAIPFRVPASPIVFD